MKIRTVMESLTNLTNVKVMTIKLIATTMVFLMGVMKRHNLRRTLQILQIQMYLIASIRHLQNRQRITRSNKIVIQHNLRMNWNLGSTVCSLRSLFLYLLPSLNLSNVKKQQFSSMVLKTLLKNTLNNWLHKDMSRNMQELMLSIFMHRTSEFSQTVGSMN